MMRALSRVALAGASLLVLASAGRSSVVVVDPAGGGDFTSLQEAVVAATDGDMLLIKSGTYGGAGFFGIFIGGKSISLCADAGASVTLSNVGINNVPAGGWVALRGLTIDSNAFAGVIPYPAVDFEGPNGTLLIEDCVIKGDEGYADQQWPINYAAQPAVRTYFGGTVLVERSTLVGGKGWPRTSAPMKWGPGNGAPAALTSGRLVLHDCTLTGGEGGWGDPVFGSGPVGANGGHGVMVDFGGFAFVAGCTSTGGATGENFTITGDKSGHGMNVDGNFASAWVRDSVFLPGPVVNSGLSGIPIAAPPNTVTTFPSATRSLAVTSPLREGQAGSLQISAVQGDQVTVMVTLGVGYSQLVTKQGVFALDTSLLFLPISLGVVTDPGGTLTLPFAAPNLPVAIEGLVLPIQLATSNAGVTTIESVTNLFWLDATF